jgi:hypothetical protein
VETPSRKKRANSLGGHPGALRLLEYANHARAGTYAEAIQLSQGSGKPPDMTATDRNGTLKYGVGFNI